MSLPPGIYLMKNRASGYYIIENDGHEAGIPVASMMITDEVPIHAKISVQKDASGLYTFKSDSNLSIGDSGKKDGKGNRSLEWQEGDFKWVIEPAGAALWNIKLPNDPLFLTDDTPPPPVATMPGFGMPSLSLPIPMGAFIGRNDRSSPVSFVQQTDNHIILNISLMIPFMNPSFPNGQTPDNISNNLPDDSNPEGGVNIDFKENLVLKKNSGIPSGARWEFVNAGA